ncbi:hypothetical protein BDF20DRAFT_883347 [Mycotypha africana]|uniref:uncharacterized protein n=1 Tax=Mycotypha africana TaxID=64632 RepID=UPI002301FDC5|nr:uncharacterized protein BDF20DRAFT_883347 [Mycotypha africana]KAI8973630.1 hypothetical protein BDF20DRAFT_883347 [Mycotypha africana]
MFGILLMKRKSLVRTNRINTSNKLNLKDADLLGSFSEQVVSFFKGVSYFIIRFRFTDCNSYHC